MLSRSPTHSPVRAQRRRHDVGEQRRLDLLQHLLAMQRFHLGRARLDRVDLEAPAARFDQRALQDALRARAPGLQLDAVFLLEARRESTFMSSTVIDE